MMYRLKGYPFWHRKRRKLTHLPDEIIWIQVRFLDDFFGWEESPTTDGINMLNEANHRSWAAQTSRQHRFPKSRLIIGALDEEQNEDLIQLPPRPASVHLIDNAIIQLSGFRTGNPIKSRTRSLEIVYPMSFLG